MSAEITLRQRIDQLVEQHGGLRMAARAIQIDASYLSRLRTGQKTNPEADTLRRLGLWEAPGKAVMYVLRKP